MMSGKHHTLFFLVGLTYGFFLRSDAASLLNVNLKIDVNGKTAIDQSLPTKARNLKQEGETCGSSRREVCGVCENGLQCDAPMDACGHCIAKKEHESTKKANCY